MPEPYESEEYVAKQQSLHVPDESVGDAAARDHVQRSLASLKPTDWVLDIGCKTGAEQEVWREHGILNTIGLDLFPDRALAKGLAVIQHDMHRLPFGDGAFDVVYCRDTIEHSPVPEKLIQEVDRVLRSGGLFFLSGPVSHPAPYHFCVLGAEDYRRLLTSFETVEEETGSDYVALLRKGPLHGA